MHTFKGRLRTAMLMHGMRTAEDLAGFAGVSVQTARSWLRSDRCNMRACRMIELSEKLGVRGYWLAAGLGVPTPVRSQEPDVAQLVDLYTNMTREQRKKLLSCAEKIGA